MQTNTEHCFDCERLANDSPMPSRPHPYLVFARQMRHSGAKEFMCVLCRARFVFPEGSYKAEVSDTHGRHMLQPRAGRSEGNSA